MALPELACFEGRFGTPGLELSASSGRQETRVRGLTTHCRRDPRNAKGDRTNSPGLPFCTCALEVGKQCLMWRLAGCCLFGLGGFETFCAASRAAPQSHKTTSQGHDQRRLLTDCTTSLCSNT